MTNLGRTIDTLEVGDRAELSRTVAESDVYLYAGITGDINPAHMDEVYASSTPFQTRIAHGLLTVGLASALLGTRLPGPGTILVSLETRFLAPVRLGDTVTGWVEVKEIVTERNRVRLELGARKADGTQVIAGETWVLAPKQFKSLGDHVHV